MLRDSAHIQEKDIETVNRREGLRGDRAKKPLYTEEDAVRASKRFQRRNYRRPFEVAEGVTATFLDAGHILGAAMVRLDIGEKGRRRSLLFTGDLGRDCLPIVRNPEPVDRADLLILETTYGDREHPPIEDTEAQLVDLVKRTVDRKGKILIPAFAVGRTQQITYLLNNLSAEGRIPPVPVFVDSPLAIETTEVFRKHPDCWDPEMVNLLREKNDADPFGFRMLTYVHSADESKKLNSLDGPAIIIAASGMCESGRILHHLANHAQNERNTILIVGYQAEGTLGRRIVEGQVNLRILGRDVERRAQVVKMNALSAHAGRGELMKFYRGFKDRVRNLFLVHGEPAQSGPFAAWAREHSTATVSVPGHGEAVEV
jgi:metallo-beta-lactamase family protein